MKSIKIIEFYTTHQYDEHDDLITERDINPDGDTQWENISDKDFLELKNTLEAYDYHREKNESQYIIIIERVPIAKENDECGVIPTVLNYKDTWQQINTDRLEKEKVQKKKQLVAKEKAAKKREQFRYEKDREQFRVLKEKFEKE